MSDIPKAMRISSRSPKTSGTSQPASAPEPRAYHHGNLRETLVEQGLQILESEGSAALSLRQIAQRIGVSQTAPLHHFKGKAGLLAAIAAEGFRRLLALRLDRLKDCEGPAQRLMTAMTVHVEFAIQHASLFHLMYGPDILNKSDFPELEEAATHSYRLFETCVADYLDFIGQPVESRGSATLAAWTASHGLATILMDQQNSPWGTVRLIRRNPIRIAHDIFSIFIAGLASHART